MNASAYAVSFAVHGIKPDAAHENAGVVCAGWLVWSGVFSYQGRVCSATKWPCVSVSACVLCCLDEMYAHACMQHLLSSICNHNGTQIHTHARAYLYSALPDV